MIWLAAASAAVWVVDRDGAGDFTTITQALGWCEAGDTIEISAGYFAPSTGEEFPWYIPSGVRLQGVGADTVIDAEGMDSFAELHSEGAVFENLTFAHAGQTALASESAAPTFRGVSFVENYRALSLRAGGLLEACSFLDNGNPGDTDGPSSIGSDSDAVLTLRDIWISDLDEGARYAVQVSNVSGAAAGSSADGVVLVGSRMYFVGDVQNLVYVGTHGSADENAACVSGTTADSLRHATILGCEDPIAFQGGLIADSIIAHSAGTAVDNSAAVAYTLLLDNAENFGSGYKGAASHVIEDQDPRFRAWSDDGDFSNDDLRLAAGSPAIDAASADSPPTDIDGVPRPQDGNGDGRPRSDIGAYEWGELDADGDGWFADGGDCDDTDPTVHPDAVDVAYDGIDQDCDGSDLVDVDGDGYDAAHQGGDDCEDTDASMYPDAWDIPDDGIDQDCDGEDAHDGDGDGWPDEDDCQPENATVFPGADELCNTIDDDCDGGVDDGIDCSTPDTAGGDPAADPPSACGCEAGRRGTAGGALLLAAVAIRRRRR